MEEVRRSIRRSSIPFTFFGEYMCRIVALCCGYIFARIRERFSSRLFLRELCVSDFGGVDPTKQNSRDSDT